MLLSDSKICKNDDFYGLLGCARNATYEQIMAEYRLKALCLHPDKIGQQAALEEGTIAEAHERFQQLQLAKEVLTDPGKRAHYDSWLAIGTTCFSLKDWMEGREKIQQTMHWTHRKEQAQLPSSAAEDDKKSSPFTWEPHNSPMSKAFRDYRL